jgi:hypothetical protein
VCGESLVFGKISSFLFRNCFYNTMKLLLFRIFGVKSSGASPARSTKSLSKVHYDTYIHHMIHVSAHPISEMPIFVFLVILAGEYPNTVGEMGKMSSQSQCSVI